MYHGYNSNLGSVALVDKVEASNKDGDDSENVSDAPYFLKTHRMWQSVSEAAWRMRHVLWGFAGFFVSLPTMMLTMLGREKIPMGEIKTLGEFGDNLINHTGASAWAAGISSIALNTPLAMMTMRVAVPLVLSVLAAMLATVGYYIAHNLFCGYKEEWFARQKERFRPEKYPRMTYLAAFIAIPAAVTFAQIAYETFNFSSGLALTAAADNFFAYYAARSYPLIYALRLLVSPELRLQTWLSWVLPVLEHHASHDNVNESKVLLESDTDTMNMMAILHNSRINRTKLAIYTPLFVLSVGLSIWLGSMGAPAFAKEFMAALVKIKIWEGAAANNYQNAGLIVGYILSALPSVALYTSFSFNFFYRLVPAVLTSVYQIARGHPHVVKKTVGWLVLACVTAYMAYESGYGMKDVGYTALHRGELDYLGNLKEGIPIFMFLGAAFVNWAPVQAIIWNRLYSYRDTDAENNNLRELHKRCSDKETIRELEGEGYSPRDKLPTHVTSVGIFREVRSTFGEAFSGCCPRFCA